jgi:hypothetical protein
MGAGCCGADDSGGSEGQRILHDYLRALFALGGQRPLILRKLVLDLILARVLTAQDVQLM